MFAPARIFALFFCVFYLINANLQGHSLATLITPFQENSKNLMQVITAEPSLSTFTKAIKAAELEKTLEGKGPFTIFAPTNAAFAELPAKSLENLLKPDNKDQLAALLKSHIVAQKIPVSKLKTESLPTLNDTVIKVRLRGSAILINDANLVRSNLAASNGMVQIIDTVLIP